MSGIRRLIRRQNVKRFGPKPRRPRRVPAWLTSILTRLTDPPDPTENSELLKETQKPWERRAKTCENHAKTRKTMTRMAENSIKNYGQLRTSVGCVKESTPRHGYRSYHPSLPLPFVRSRFVVYIALFDKCHHSPAIPTRTGPYPPHLRARDGWFLSESADSAHPKPGCSFINSLHQLETTSLSRWSLEGL